MRVQLDTALYESIFATLGISRNPARLAKLSHLISKLTKGVVAAQWKCAQLPIKRSWARILPRYRYRLKWNKK